MRLRSTVLGLGGAVWNGPGGALRVTGATFVNNVGLGGGRFGSFTGGAGGAIYSGAGARLDVSDSAFIGNRVTGGAVLAGGAIAGHGDETSLAIRDSTFEGNEVIGGVTVRVTITNLAPANGLFLTPFWVGFHDGSFDLYDRGLAIGAGALPAGLEALVEDGNTGPLTGDFAASPAARNRGLDSTLSGPGGRVAGPLDPGETVSALFTLDPASNRFFSYASMIIPSNDAFIANGNPLAHPLFDVAGNFVGAEILVLGSAVLDGGTEVNTEEDAAFLNQAAPNTGVTENGTVVLHPGFNGSLANPNGTPVNILGTTQAGPGRNILIDPIAGDFSQPRNQIARIRIEVVPSSGLRASLGGAVALVGAGTADISDSTFTGNRAVGRPGAAGADGGFGLGGAVANTSVAGNPTLLGGVLTIRDSSFSGNEARGGDGGAGLPGGNGGNGQIGGGGAVFNDEGSILTLSHSTIVGNRAISGNGGAAGQGGTGGSSREAEGGGVKNIGGVAFISHTLFSGNEAVGGSGADGARGGDATGGGFANLRGVSPATGRTFLGDAVVTDSTFLGNRAVGGNSDSATGGNGLGGGIFNDVDSTLAVEGTELAGNQAVGGAGSSGGDGQGGGLFNSAGATLDLVRSRLFANLARGGEGSDGEDGEGQGGGIYLAPSSISRRQRSRLFSNFASTDGGDLFGPE